MGSGRRAPALGLAARARTRLGAWRAALPGVRAQALLEERHEIHDLALPRSARPLLHLVHDLVRVARLHLLLDEGHDFVAVVVLVLLRLPLDRHVVDEALGHLDLGLRDGARTLGL